MAKRKSTKLCYWNWELYLQCIFCISFYFILPLVSIGAAFIVHAQVECDEFNAENITKIYNVDVWNIKMIYFVTHNKEIAITKTI